MKKLKLMRINSGEFFTEEKYIDIIEAFNNGMVKVTETNIVVVKSNNKIFESTLVKTEEDTLTVTYQGKFMDGTAFRLVKPSKLMSQNDSVIVFGSLSGDGYAVRYEMNNINSDDNESFIRSRDTGFFNASDSKAEFLLKTAKKFRIINPIIAKEHMQRFLNLMEKNNFELLKFSNIQNILNGYVLASELNLLSDQDVEKSLKDLKVSFQSKKLSRYSMRAPIKQKENYPLRREVSIKPNYESINEYFVAIHNRGFFSFLQKKPLVFFVGMKVVKVKDNEIILEGSGFSDFNEILYRIILHKPQDLIDSIRLEMIREQKIIDFYS